MGSQPATFRVSPPPLPADVAPTRRTRPQSEPKLERELAAGTGAGAKPRRLSFAEVYERGFDTVWRALRGLGVGEAHIDDAVQEVFVVVARRLPEFEYRARIETWLFAIARRVAARQRRTAARREGRSAELPAEIPDTRAIDPEAAAESAEAARLLADTLDELDDDKRAILFLVDVEQWTVPAAAEALGIKLNTAYSRLRLARRRFEAALCRRAGKETT